MSEHSLGITSETNIDHDQQVEKLNAEVHELRQLLRQSQRMASVGTMTAMIAHEFNNILTPIINYAQMAQTNPTFAPKAITRAASGGLRASEICEAILGMTHNSPAELQSISLKDLLEETLVAMARDFSKDRIELTLDIPEELEISTRKIELQQVFLNLLINARSAVMQSNRTRRITIVTTCTQQTVTTRVSDTGMGITPGNMKQIFDPFFTTKDGQDDHEQGHGLGLALCREIIESLDGEITAESAKGQGATFTVTLPL
ncbi:MAG: GHKL domain-containing protein [Phycisphaerales bacterium]|jgi:signal transduction histidine kinase|nr:GHKL domain-containing protein [Phycisphaerales bacterium]